MLLPRFFDAFNHRIRHGIMSLLYHMDESSEPTFQDKLAVFSFRFFSLLIVMTCLLPSPQLSLDLHLCCLPKTHISEQEFLDTSLFLFSYPLFFYLSFSAEINKKRLLLFISPYYMSSICYYFIYNGNISFSEFLLRISPGNLLRGFYDGSVNINCYLFHHLSPWTSIFSPVILQLVPASTGYFCVTVDGPGY